MKRHSSLPLFGASLRCAIITTAAVLNTHVFAGDVLMPAIPEYRTADTGEIPSFKLAAPLPDVAARLPVFTVKPFQGAVEYMEQISKRLGLSGKIVYNDKGKFALRTLAGEKDQQTLSMFEATGGFFYRYDKLIHAVPDRQPNLPDDEKAYDIALRFLKEHDLLPRDAVIDRQRVTFAKSRLVEFDGKTGKTLSEYVTGIDVRFPQLWDGHHVTGPGSKLYVAIGDQGRVLGVTKMWRESAGTPAYLPSIPPELALKNLQNRQGRLSVPSGCTLASIEQVTLAYWLESPKRQQRTSLPVYTVNGTCYSAEGDDLGKFEGYAAALASTDLRINMEKDRADLSQDDDSR